jgi:hypothetical protein
MPLAAISRWRRSHRNSGNLSLLSDLSCARAAVRRLGLTRLIMSTSVRRRVLIAGAATLCGPLGLANSALAGRSLPLMFSTISLHGSTPINVFKLRPKSVVTDSADGGELVIHWTSWTNTRASGSGRAHPDHGSYPIRVIAGRPRSGYFTRLLVISKDDGRSYRDQLGLGYLGGISLAWINLSWMRNPASGSTPWPS